MPAKCAAACAAASTRRPVNSMACVCACVSRKRLNWSIYPGNTYTALALNRFFSLSNTTPVIRYLDLPERIPPLAVQPPLRLLAMIAGPRDYPPLDVEQEWRKLRSALQELEEAGLVILERLQPATLSALQRRLRQGACHILHFVGHGAFDEATQDGVLLLEDEEGRGRAVSAQDLGVLLHDHPSLRLVMLNSCEGARTSGSIHSPARPRA